MIYRVHKYPILASTNENETQSTTSSNFPSKNQYHLVINKYTGATIHPDIIPYLDGKHHYDEICTDLECSPQELNEQLGCTQQQFEQSKHVVDTVYEDDKQNEGQPQWCVQFIFR